MNDPIRRRVRLGRRTRHRRRRFIRRFTLALLIVTVAGTAAWRLASELGSTPVRVEATPTAWESADPRTSLAFLAAKPHKKRWIPKSRLLYPYSIIPGGVEDPDELRLVAENDHIVRQHFAGFNFKRARVVQLSKPRVVYLSYRLGDQVFWTKKRVRLPRGEKLISDGTITARTRCGNRVEEVAQDAVSPEEPSPEKFEQPMMADGSTMRAPFPGFPSSLLSSEGPSLISSNGPPAMGPLPGGILFPVGAPIPPCGKNDDGKIDPKDCRPTPPPPQVPEPGTIILVSSGLAGVYMRYRSKRRGTQP